MTSTVLIAAFSLAGGWQYFLAVVLLLLASLVLNYTRAGSGDQPAPVRQRLHLRPRGAGTERPDARRHGGAALHARHALNSYARPASGSSSANLPLARPSVPSSGYSPVKQASQWVARVERIASYTPSSDR